MKLTSPLFEPSAHARKGIRLASLLLLATAIGAGPLSAKEEEDEFSETPAKKFIENIPASRVLLTAPTRRRVSAFGFSASSSSTPAWKALGPFPIPNGQTQNRVDPVSGRTTVIAVNPTNADVAYVGTAQGGLYRTLNGGATWSQLMDNASVGAAAGAPLAIGSVVVDPVNNSTVFVGTGEGNLSADSFFGTGFYIITNADSFSPIVSGPFNAASGLDSGVAAGADIFTGRSIVAIAVDPTNDNNVFVATGSGVGGIVPTAFNVLPRRGLYRSTNALSGSPSWTRLQITGTTSLNTIATSLAMEPGTPTNLLVSYYGQSAADPSGIYRTTGALDPTPVFSAAQVLPNFINVKLAIQKTGAAVTAYATADQSSGTIYKSTNGGASFSNLTSANGFAGGQGFYDIAVGVDPTNANNVSVGGNTGTNIFRFSTDGGATFGSSVTGLHADVHGITYAPSNPAVIYHGNDGGIWRSIDGGANWKALNNGTFSATQFSGIALHPIDRNYTLGGTQDNGTEQIRPDGSFFRVDFGDGGYSLIDQTAADTENVTMYHTYFNQANNLIGTGRNLKTSCATEGQWSFHGIYGGAVSPTPYCDGTTDTFNGILLTDNVNFYAPMVLGPSVTGSTGNTWYFGTDKLYRSINRADTAQAASQLLDQTTAGTPPTGTPISAIAVSLLDDNFRIVGLNNGKIFATNTGTNALLQIAGTGATNGPTTTPARSVGRIVFDPNDKNIAYIAYGGYGGAHVYKITNLNLLPAGSATITSMGSGLPDAPVNALAIDPLSGSSVADSTDIYAGTDLGVYNSRDGGATWSVYGSGFPRVSVFGLEIQSSARIVRAATHGRGMYENFLALQPTTPQLSQVVSRKTHGTAGTFDINMPLTGVTGVEDRSGGSGNNYTIVFTFTNMVTSGSANVAAGAGTVSSVTFSGSDMSVNLTGVTSPQVITVNVTGVTDVNNNVLSSASVNVGILVGDTNADRTVGSGDTIQARNNSGQVTDGTNFRTDVNADGIISSADAFIVRSKAGTSIP